MLFFKQHGLCAQHFKRIWMFGAGKLFVNCQRTMKSRQRFGIISKVQLDLTEEKQAVCYQWLVMAQAFFTNVYASLAQGQRLRVISQTTVNLGQRHQAVTHIRVVFAQHFLPDFQSPLAQR